MRALAVAVLFLAASAARAQSALGSATKLEMKADPAGVFDGSSIPKDGAAFKAAFLGMKSAPASPALGKWSPQAKGSVIGTAVGLMGAGVPAGIWLSRVDKQASPTHGYLEAIGAQLFVLAGVVVCQVIGGAIGRRVGRKRAELERYYPPYSY